MRSRSSIAGSGNTANNSQHRRDVSPVLVGQQRLGLISPSSRDASSAAAPSSTTATCPYRT
eukprot:CAMPEP_0181381196 /NCGR_PEP_ID=MMETSP1106-20121128/19986_1 /TAXON_ID=81844 /ORGANISM="Mantoniella antarctica, Strain SL-175" /LENGTH=60 /DNA_ID=CAMNT_0023500351 /DNA_START=73 /DNA_END=251 /DNA_ORIENTATION=+